MCCICLLAFYGSSMVRIMQTVSRERDCRRQLFSPPGRPSQKFVRAPQGENKKHQHASGERRERSAARGMTGNGAEGRRCGDLACPLQAKRPELSGCGLAATRRSRAERIPRSGISEKAEAGNSREAGLRRIETPRHGETREGRTLTRSMARAAQYGAEIWGDGGGKRWKSLTAWSQAPC